MTDPKQMPRTDEKYFSSKITFSCFSCCCGSMLTLLGVHCRCAVQGVQIPRQLLQIFTIYTLLKGRHMHHKSFIMHSAPCIPRHELSAMRHTSCIMHQHLCIISHGPCAVVSWTLYRPYAMCHVTCVMHHALRIMHHASHFTHHAVYCTHHASSHPVSCLMPTIFCIMRQTSCSYAMHHDPFNTCIKNKYKYS